MCNEENMEDMFKQDIPGFDEKFVDFAFLVKG